MFTVVHTLGNAKSRIALSLVGASILAATGCGGDAGGGGDGDAGGGDGGGDAPPGLVSPSDLCTTWTDRSALHFSCITTGGDWVEREPLATASECDPPSRFGETNLARADDGSILGIYTRWCTDEFLVKRFSGGAWTAAADLPVNYEGGAILPTYSQFGPSIVSFDGEIRALWTDSNTVFHSRWDGAAWQHDRYLMVENDVIRHPGFVVDGSSLWLHHGQPTPAAYNATSGPPNALGTIPVDDAVQYTLYTSLGFWQGNPVLAFTTFVEALPWPDITDETHVAFWNGSSWTVDTSGIQDTPGHDGSNPFLFVEGGELFIVYPDYTTDGLPTDSQSVSYRLRVKRWNGSGWERVGGESETIWLSQRLEYLQHEGRVYVSVIRRGTASEQVVLAWDGSQFAQVGSVLASFPSDGQRPRPGNVVHAAPP